MQQYFMAFLKSGTIRDQNEEEAEILQKEHLAHLSKMYELGYADISGPFGDNGEIRGITIYNVPTLKMADSLANADPMVKAGRLVIEMHPWWAAKGFPFKIMLKILKVTLSAYKYCNHFNFISYSFCNKRRQL